MCYSTMVKSDVKELARIYKARVDRDAFTSLYAMREKDLEIKIPLGMDLGAADLSPAIRGSIRKYKELFAEKCAQDLRDLDAEVLEIEARLKTKATKTWQAKLESKGRAREKLLKKIEKSNEEHEGDTYRIYPLYYAPVVVFDGKERVIRPMRYRVLPSSGVEIPSKYNVFNARRDSLGEARTWKAIFGKKHAIFPFTRFYEWVEGKNGRPVELKFSPDGFEEMWAASLYDSCQTKNGLIESFAMVTDEPPPEVSAAGHDRCPVFLRHDLLDQWMNPAKTSLKELDALLDHKEKTYYSNALVA